MDPLKSYIYLASSQDLQNYKNNTKISKCNNIINRKTICGIESGPYYGIIPYIIIKTESDEIATNIYKVLYNELINDNLFSLGIQNIGFDWFNKKYSVETIKSILDKYVYEYEIIEDLHEFIENEKHIVQKNQEEHFKNLSSENKNTLDTNKLCIIL